MSALRRFAAVLVADLRERTRSTRFWVVLALTAIGSWWCFPSMDAGYATVNFGTDERALYSSAWVGMVLGLMYGTMLSLIGFYLVRGTLVRDFETRVWELVVATPMTRTGYLLAKWASHLAVFALICVLGLVVGLVAQQWRGEDRALDLLEALKPVLLISLPSLAVTAFFAVLFDLVPFLRKTLGNVLFFFAWMFVFAMSLQYMNPEKVEWARHTWLSDPSGIALVLRDFSAQLGSGFNANGLSIGMSEFEGKPKLFAWTHWDLGAMDALGRLLWVAVSAGLVAMLSPMLDWAAARVRVSAGAAGTAQPGRKLRWLEPLLRPLALFPTGLVLAAELRLALRARKGWWWLAMLVLWGFMAFGTPEAVNIAAIGAWLICIDVFARLILRERETGTGALVFSNSGASRRILGARVAAALVLSLGVVLPGLLHLALAAPATALAMAVAAVAIAIGGLGLGALCRNPRPAELVMVGLAYVGVQNGGPLAFAAQPEWALMANGIGVAVLGVALLACWPLMAKGSRG